MSGFPPLHVVTDDDVLARPGFSAAASAVLRHGPAVTLHLRGHATTGLRLYHLALELLPVARASGARLVLNDRVDVALAVAADGVQLGHGSLAHHDVRRVWPDAWLGASVRAHEAPFAGTDFVLLGTIYDSPGHADRSLAGVRGLRRACAAWNVPVVAIGGIDRNRIAAVIDAGAQGIAAIRAVWDRTEPGSAAAGLLEEWDTRRGA